MKLTPDFQLSLTAGPRLDLSLVLPTFVVAGHGQVADATVAGARRLRRTRSILGASPIKLFTAVSYEFS